MIYRFYYILHILNLESILKFGIYSHNRIKNSQLNYTRIFDNYIIKRRELIKTPANKNLLDYVNLYFQPRNPMLYRVIKEFGENNIVVLGIDGNVIYKDGVFITDGNAASAYSNFYSISDIDYYTLNRIQLNTKAKIWYNNWRVKIELMAECLVPDIVENSYIKEIYVSNFSTKNNLNYLNCNLPIIISSYFFFKD